jgi:hypothetical protein
MCIVEELLNVFDFNEVHGPAADDGFPGLRVYGGFRARVVVFSHRCFAWKSV